MIKTFYKIKNLELFIFGNGKFVGFLSEEVRGSPLDYPRPRSGEVEASTPHTRDSEITSCGHLIAFSLDFAQLLVWNRLARSSDIPLTDWAVTSSQQYDSTLQDLGTTPRHVRIPLSMPPPLPLSCRGTVASSTEPWWY